MNRGDLIVHQNRLRGSKCHTRTLRTELLCPQRMPDDLIRARQAPNLSISSLGMMMHPTIATLGVNSRGQHLPDYPHPRGGFAHRSNAASTVISFGPDSIY